MFFGSLPHVFFFISGSIPGKAFFGLKAAGCPFFVQIRGLSSRQHSCAAGGPDPSWLGGGGLFPRSHTQLGGLDFETNLLMQVQGGVSFLYEGFLNFFGYEKNPVEGIQWVCRTANWQKQQERLVRPFKGKCT